MELQRQELNQYACSCGRNPTPDSAGTLGLPNAGIVCIKYFKLSPKLLLQAVFLIRKYFTRIRDPRIRNPKLQYGSGRPMNYKSGSCLDIFVASEKKYVVK